MPRFNRDECEALFELAVSSVVGHELNETIHFNHPNCPAGMDTKKRLYATPTEDGTGVLFYCHHCQGRGVYRVKKYTPPRGLNIDKLGFDPDNVVTPLPSTKKLTPADLADVYRTGGQFPPPNTPSAIVTTNGNAYMLACLTDVWETFKARDFYGLRLREKTSYVDRERKTVYALPYYQLFLPTFEDGVLTGLWMRNHPNSINKVIVWGSAKKILYDYQEKERFLVVVEDPISAIKLDCLGVPAYSLGGLDMTAGEVIKLRALYDRVVVWLDNDSASDKVVDVIVRTLQLAGHRKVQTVRSAPEPKKCDAERIKEELTYLGLPVRV